MTRSRIAFFAAFASLAFATMPPKPGTNWPTSLRQFAQQGRLSLSPRGYTPWVNRVRANRAAVAQGTMTAAAAQAAGGVLVQGTRSIPVLMAKFSNTGADPYPPANLQKELFDGPWPTGTMTDFYKETSYNKLTVNGTVFAWKQMPQNDTFYEGGSGCNGLCNNSKVGDLLQSTLTMNDGAINFGQFDNDGPDGTPNSGDDDGFVDFVAFVHPEAGGECGNSNIWSHRWIYSGWKGAPFTTNDAKAGGGNIRVEDYVIQPGFGCDGSTMIQIGVFAHEFGHAFGLPDLYDTDPNNGTSSGMGVWCLMASGSWGGDNNSPDRPTHMSSWAKEFLGWISPTEVTADLKPALIAQIETNAVAFKIPVSPTQYYLVSNHQKTLFDSKFPTAGLAIVKVNQTVIDSGMNSNTVNADENNQGVEIQEADGQKHLDNNSNRGDAGDLYPGSSNKKAFDTTSNPASIAKAVCQVGAPGVDMSADLIVSGNSCGTGGGGGGGCSGIVPLPSGGSGGNLRNAGMLVMPLVAVLWLLMRRNRASAAA